MKIAEAKKLLNDWKQELFNHSIPGTECRCIECQKEKNLIEAAKTVQRAEDVQIVQSSAYNEIMYAKDYFVMLRDLDGQYQQCFSDMAWKALEGIEDKLTQGGDPLT